MHYSTPSVTRGQNTHTPRVTPRPISASIWEPFNKPEYSVSLGKDDKDFCHQDVQCCASNPPSPSPLPPGVGISYCLYTPNGDKSQFLGSAVLTPHGLCPPFDACPNTNLFQHFFGIKFHYKNHTHVQGISQFEFAHCFGFINNLTYRLSKPANKYCLNTAVPEQTSVWLFNQVFDCLVLIRDMYCKIMSSRQHAAPAATIQSFVNGAVASQLSSREQWIEAYRKNKECKMLLTLIKNPGKISKDSLKDIHYCSGSRCKIFILS